MIGQTISHYRILDKLGEGGMGVVYKAEDTKLARKVALKFLPPSLMASDGAKARFLREARAAAAAQHPNICTIHEIGEFEERPFIAMAYIKGCELADEIEHGPFEMERLLEVSGQLADGLKEAHKKGVVHRDINPRNIMISSDGRAVLMDFGLAQVTAASSKLTREGTTVGTTYYMSPEQTSGAEVDHRTDIWSLGVILYEMASGERPFKGHYEQAIQYSILNESPEPLAALRPDVPARLQQIVDKCLAKDADERYVSVDELYADLVAFEREAEAGGDTESAQVGSAEASPRRTFVGRQEETAELRRLLTSAQKGRGGLVLIGGEPGVGKTRLCEEILADASEQGMLVLTGHSYEGEGVQSVLPFVESLEAAMRTVPRANLRAALSEAAPEIAKLTPQLRDLFDDIPEPVQLPAEQQQRYLFNAFHDFVERLSRQRPIAWMLDDLHWADDSSLLLLEHLALSVERLPALVLGTYRDVELEVGKPFEKALTQLVRQRRAQRMALRRLPEASVAELLESLGGAEPPEKLVHAIYHETEGNPFFVEEVFEHLSEEGKLFDEDGRWKGDLKPDELEVPEGVRLVIGRRLERLSPEAPKILAAAALIGRVFELGTLESLEGHDPDAVLDAIDEAEAAKLIGPASTGREVSYRFTHELIRHTLLVGLSIRRRQRTHLRIADVLEKKSANSVSRIAHHLYQAGASADLDKTVRYLKLAGERELGTGALKEALEHFDAALGLLEDESTRTRAELLRLKGRAEHTQGNTGPSLTAWTDAAALFETLGDVDEMAQTCLEFVMQAYWRADYDAALPILRRGLAATDRDTGPDRCRLLGAGSVLLVGSGDLDKGPPLCDEALAMAEGAGDPVVLGDVLASKVNLGWALMTGEQWVKDSQRSIELLRSAGNLWEWVYQSGWSSVGLVFAGRVEEALQPSEAEEVAQRLGHLNAQACFKIAREFAGLVQTGDIEAFRSFAEWYRDWSHELDYPWGLVAYAHLGLCSFWQGDWAGFHDDFQRGIADEEARPNCYYSWGNYFMAMAYAGDSRALELLEKKRSTLPRMRPYNSLGAWVALMRTIEGLAIMGRREEAAELYPLAKLSTQTGTQVEFFGTAMPQLPAGIAAACGRDWATAEQHYQTALEQAQAMPHRMAQADIRRWYARMLLDRNEAGDSEKARNLLREAKTTYLELGMPKHVEMAERLMRA